MSRFSSRAPQLMERNGPLARWLTEWMASAVSSLPVPVSPTMSTSASTRAALWMC